MIELEMTVHVFGCLSSSACANFALRRCASDFPKDSPVGKEILRSFYVDDYLSSFDTVKTARDTISGVYRALKNGGFTLTKFRASEGDALTGVPDEHLVVASGTESGKEIKSHEQSALGVSWDVERDALIFKFMPIDLVCSKRGVLSAIAKICYDPCGLLSVILLPGRLLFQELCRREAKWDDALDETEERHFRKWLDGIADRGAVEIPRCFRPTDFGDVWRREIHFLSDASEVCYGVACYLKEVSVDGNISCSLIFVKSRLAPLRRNLTLVKLELQAAATSVMVRNLLVPELDVPIDDVYYWTDSLPVLGYISNNSKRFQVFTAIRIAQIRESSEVSSWHWLLSHLNTSDIVTRGIKEGEILDANHPLFRGPDFLFSPDGKLPMPPTGQGTVRDDDPELRRKQTTLATVEQQKSVTDTLLVKFASFHRAKLAVAVLKKFVRYRTKRVPPSRISLSDLKSAEISIIGIAQKEQFAVEIELLKCDRNVTLPKNSSIRNLSPILGPDGLLRVGGRIKNFAGAYEFKHPIILPKKHHVTELLIREAHCANGHGSVKQILNELRTRFYVVGGRSTVHALWVRCLKCRRMLAQPGDQFMHSLPATRLKPFAPAFTYTAVDLFGPFFAKVGRSNVKRWGVAFICENSKCVHLEIVSSLDMDSFVNALRRMIGRRVTPKRLVSDQGSNLRAADRELTEALERWNSTDIEGRLKQRGIEWVFCPPTASHMNGLAERIIRSARTVLVHLLGDQPLTDEALQTLFVECESILNKRPIAEWSSDPADGRALTPAHLLQPRPDEIDLPPDIFQPDDSLSKK